MKARVLVVDDEEIVIRSCLRILGDDGDYEVEAAQDGLEALKKIDEVHYDILILDIMMPKMDGTEVAMLLKNDMRTRHIPIFFVTAVIAPEDQAYTKGSPNLIFAKPLKLHELLMAINNLSMDGPSGG